MLYDLKSLAMQFMTLPHVTKEAHAAVHHMEKFVDMFWAMRNICLLK